MCDVGFFLTLPFLVLVCIFCLITAVTLLTSGNRCPFFQRPFQSTPQYGYTWSPPTQSNETSNGYFLERSHSALMCLEKADELCPEEVSRERGNFTLASVRVRGGALS